MRPPGDPDRPGPMERESVSVVRPAVSRTIRSTPANGGAPTSAGPRAARSRRALEQTAGAGARPDPQPYPAYRHGRTKPAVFKRGSSPRPTKQRRARPARKRLEGRARRVARVVCPSRATCRGRAQREVDGPLPRRPPGQVHPVHPRLQDIGVGPSVRVRWQTEPLTRLVARDVERTALRVAHERHGSVLPGRCWTPDEVDAGAAATSCQVGVRSHRRADRRDERETRTSSSAPENRRAPQAAPAGSPPNGVGRDQPGARRLAGGDLPACLAVLETDHLAGCGAGAGRNWWPRRTSTCSWKCACDGAADRAADLPVATVLVWFQRLRGVSRLHGRHLDPRQRRPLGVCAAERIDSNMEWIATFAATTCSGRSRRKSSHGADS